MEELNKTQVILLTLFITFVTSVTTGIVTVTLLQQAPPAVTQTINRVVERTIEKVAPVIKTEVKETRVVFGQEDQIVKTATLVRPAIVRIVFSGDTVVSTNSTNEVNSGANQLADASSANQASLISANTGLNKSDEVGTGFLVSSDGLVVTSHDLIPDQNIKYGVFVKDKRYGASVVFYNKNDGLAILKIDHDNSVKFLVPQFASRSVTLGQTAIVLGRDLTRYTVSVGLVSSLKEADTSSLPSFKTTVKSDETNIGGPLLNSEGLVIGLNLPNGNAISAELIRSRLNSSSSTTTKSTAIII